MVLAVLDQNCAKLLIFVGCFKIGAVNWYLYLSGSKRICICVCVCVCVCECVTEKEGERGGGI